MNKDNKKLTKSQKPEAISHKLVIGWLYPELMNIHGDRGNIIALTKRSNWRGIKTGSSRTQSRFRPKAACYLRHLGNGRCTRYPGDDSDYRLLRIQKILLEKIEMERLGYIAAVDTGFRKII